jgi:hypothetical protein
MYPIGHQEIAAQRIADLHGQATRQRLLRELRAARRPAARRRWEWLTSRRPQPAATTQTRPAWQRVHQG